MNCLIAPLVVAVCLHAAPGLADAWHEGFCLSNGDSWRSRLPITVRNDAQQEARGVPVGVEVGRAPRQADLAGAGVEAVRVCDDTGLEMLYNIVGPDGEEIHAGPIPDGCRLILPAQCAAGATARYWVYFDDPAAWGVPDWLPAQLGIRNGGFEAGDGAVPAGWHNDTLDAQHRIAWVDVQPRSGQRCMQTSVDSGAPSTWIATRQQGLLITGGARYVLRAWVRAQDVVGYAGWYIHVGNAQNSMLIAPMLSGGGGTYEWREVVAEFTAPAEADRADVGTVLYGTGTAWFDDVSLECLEPPRVSATAGARESLHVAEVGTDAPWYDDDPADSRTWQCRVPVRVANYSDTPMVPGLISVDLAGVLARTRGGREQVRAVLNGQVVPSYQFQDLLLIEGGLVPPRTLQVCYVYLAGPSSQAGPDQRAALDNALDADGALLPRTGAALPEAETLTPQAAAAPGYETLLHSPRNLVRNPSFELGTGVPADWSGGGEGERPAQSAMRLVEPGLFGALCARISIPHDSAPNWFGWRQDVPVEPRKSYLYACWLKCEELQGGLQLHAHFRNAAGALCEKAQMVGAGPAIDGTTDWSLVSGVFTMPDDVAHCQLHLTMNSTGTAWHDGALLLEETAGRVGRLESRTSPAIRGIAIWQVNSVVKVFQEDTPPPDAPPARISMARNEFEPLQLAVRSDRAVPHVHVQVDAPRSAAGTVLNDLEIGVVGYVPIDYPTNYYSTKTAAWVRKYPASAPACDGWAGYWPDPLLPRDTFELPAGVTQPVWITFRTAAAAAPGDYMGTVRLTTADGAELGRVPFTVHVWDFALPKENHVAAVYDLRMSSRWDIPGKSPREVRRDFLKFMAEHRVCPDTIEPAPDIRYENGQVVADFTDFDQAAEYALDELGMTHFYTPWYFYLFGWGFPPGEKFGEKPYEGDYPYPGADRSVLRPQFKQAYQAVLRTYWEHLKQRGWDKKCVLYISDEPFYSQPDIIAQMKALCQMIHEVDPEIFIYCSTWAHIPEWDGYINCWGIGHYGIVSPDVIARRRTAGDRIRWTTDGQMCTDTPYCAVERLLPAYCFKYGAEAYEFWGINWLTYDPYTWGWHSYIFQSDTPENAYYVRYPNGDGFLAYPGAPIGHDGPVTSIRIEQVREGCEDYEYLYLLRELIEQAGAAGADTAAAEQAMAYAQELVTIPNAGGRYSTRILPDPARVFVVRDRVAAAVEALSDERRP